MRKKNESARSSGPLRRQSNWNKTESDDHLGSVVAAALVGLALLTGVVLVALGLFT